MPEFSIVTSFYNEPTDYIQRLYDQILKTGVDWEWIVTDDFSDNQEIDKKLTQISLRDTRVRKIIQSQKREIFKNPSIYCRGKFIFHIDGDDLFHPIYLKQAKKWFEKFPDVVCIISGSCWIRESGSIIRYENDDPFCFPHEKNGLRYPLLNYLGRIWRSEIKLDFSDIFTNQQDIIRFNDRFIVEYLSTRGDILHLPRPYIIYTQRKSSNSNRERNSEEIKLIEKTSYQFESWLEKNRSWFPKNPHFYVGETSFFDQTLAFQHIVWSSERRKCGVFGFSNLPVLRKLLIELYPELDIIFDPTEDLLEGIPIFVVDDLEIENRLPKNTQIYYATKDIHIREDFFENIVTERSTRWVLSEDILWICLYR
jgi:hypothetical protein